MTARIPALLVVLALASSATAATLRVPGDYDRLQDAVDAAVAGDEIRCSGTLSESVAIVDRADLAIRGKCLIEGGVTCIRIENSQRITLVKLELTATTSSVVTITDSTDVVVSNCRVRDGAADGILVVNSDRLRIEKSRIEDVAGHGIHMPRVEGDSSADCVIEKNRIDACGVDGIQCPGTERIYVFKNRIADCGEEGIAFRADGGAVDAFVLKNKLSDLDGSGMVVGGTGARVMSNKVTRARYVGIEMHGSNNTAEANKVKTVGDDGIAFVDGPGRAVGNRISDVGFFFPDGAFETGDGIEVDTDGHTIADNVIKRVRSSGVHLWDTDGCTVVGNRIIGAGDDGVKVEGDGHSLTDNRVSKVGDDGFEVSGTGNTLRGNRAKKSPDYDLEDNAGAGANSYASNVFGTTNL